MPEQLKNSGAITKAVHFPAMTFSSTLTTGSQDP
jgi:hypothetical protein